MVIYVKGRVEKYGCQGWELPHPPIAFLPTPLAVAWIFRLTFSSSSPPSSHFLFLLGTENVVGDMGPSLYSTQPCRLCLNSCSSILNQSLSLTDSQHCELLIFSKQYKPVWCVQVWTYDQEPRMRMGGHTIYVTLTVTCQLLNANICPCIDILEGSGSYGPFSKN